ncbi:MAG: oligosaccharide flippase family protein [Bacteroidota bacterium]
MNPLKKLAGETGIYSIGILSRFLNYLLIPYYCRGNFVPEQFGVYTEMYAYVAFLVVLLTYGLETAFFRFASKKGAHPDKTFSTLLISICSTSLLFISLAIFFKEPISIWLKYPNHSEYVSWFAIIVGLDAISSLFLARLRFHNKAKKFVGVNLANILVNIGFNILFISYFIQSEKLGYSSWIIEKFHIPGTGVGYIFIANLIASIFKLSLLIPAIKFIRHGFNLQLWKNALRYSLPLLVAGLAGMANETLDRILLKWVMWPLGEIYTMEQLGIYGANYKMAILIALFLAALRYAAEPFYFKYEKEPNAKQVYAQVMKWVVIILCCMVLTVVLNIDVFRYFIGNEQDGYWQGLGIVPIVMFAYVAFGIYQNNSIWFKLNEKTYYGILFTLLGAGITVVLNLWLIPKIEYWASAWATLICYVSMAVCSIAVGQRQFYIPYEFGRIGLYLGMCILLVLGSIQLNIGEYVNTFVYLLINCSVILLFIFFILKTEKIGLLDLKSFLRS